MNASPTPLDYAHGPTRARRTGPLAFWFNLPFFVRVVIGLAIGLALGLALHPHWAGKDSSARLRGWVYAFGKTSELTLRILGALAPPLILTAVMRALIGTHIQGRTAGRLIYLMVLNTVVACVIGLIVVNVVRPGEHATSHLDARKEMTHSDPIEGFLNSVPPSLLQPLVETNSVGLILIAITFGLAARQLPENQRAVTLAAINIAFDLIVKVLFWALELVPLAVACKVGNVITTLGLDPFRSLGWFVVSVILALLFQGCYYMVRVRLRSWVRPAQLLRQGRDAYVMAFSTGSSTATMPLTYECMTERLGLRGDSASLGVLVGGNFNHDGTALYQAMCALFVAQLSGNHLSIVQQAIVVVTALVSAMGMAGIPEASLVTMGLIFNAVGLDVTYVALLLPVDWFLDRCRTAINVMGDTSVACLLDGTKRHAVDPVPTAASEPIAVPGEPAIA
jgi:Na+/H+-dicarboxylate symporter